MSYKTSFSSSVVLVYAGATEDYPKKCTKEDEKLTNEEILASLEEIKERERRRTTRVVLANGKQSKYTLEQLGGKPVSGKGHINFYKGKAIDREKFTKAVDTFFAGSSIRGTWKMSGLSCPTYTKRLNQLMVDGFLPAELMSDGKPFYLIFDDSRMDDLMEKYRKSR